MFLFQSSSRESDSLIEAALVGLGLRTDGCDDALVPNPMVEGSPCASPSSRAKFAEARLPPHCALVRIRESWPRRHQFGHHVPDRHPFARWQRVEFPVGCIEEKDRPHHSHNITSL